MKTILSFLTILFFITNIALAGGDQICNHPRKGFLHRAGCEICQAQVKQALHSVPTIDTEAAKSAERVPTKSAVVPQCHDGKCQDSKPKPKPVPPKRELPDISFLEGCEFNLDVKGDTVNVTRNNQLSITDNWFVTTHIRFHKKKTTVEYVGDWSPDRVTIPSRTEIQPYFDNRLLEPRVNCNQQHQHHEGCRHEARLLICQQRHDHHDGCYGYRRGTSAAINGRYVPTSYAHDLHRQFGGYSNAPSAPLYSSARIVQQPQGRNNWNDWFTRMNP